MFKSITFSVITFFLVNLIYGQTVYVDYHFNGDYKDSSSNANHLIKIGTGTDINYNAGRSNVVADSSVRINNGKAFTSTKILDNATWNGMSIVTWVKGNGTRLGNVFTGSYSGGGLFVNANGTISGYYDGSSSGSLISTTKINDSKWHQIVLQTDGDTTFMYIDGKLELKKAERMYRTVGANQNAKFYIGTARIGGYVLTDYDIDRLIIYNDVLSQKMIDSLNKITCPCNCKKDTVFVHDTLRLTDTVVVYDTIVRYDTIRIRDTIIINDTSELNVGIQLETHELELVLYPNPSNQYLKLNGIVNSSEVKVYNLSGVEMNQVFSIEENEGSITLDISDLTEGLYFLVHEEHTVRFVKTD